MRACTPIMEARKNRISVKTESAFSNKTYEAIEASRKLVILDNTIRHPHAQRTLRNTYQALSSGIVPLKCARSRDSKQGWSTIPKASSGVSSKYALAQMSVAAKCHSKMSLESLPFVYCQEISGEGSGAREVDSVPFTFSMRAMSATSRVATPPKSGFSLLK